MRSLRAFNECHPFKDVPLAIRPIAFTKRLTKQDIAALVDYLFSTLSGRKELKMKKYLAFEFYGPVMDGFDQDDTLP